MTEERKEPKLRFPGFTDPWEQRKLGKICQIAMGQSPDGSTYSDTPSDFILVQGNADLKDGWVSPRIWTTQKTKTAQAGDLIMSVRAPAGAMGKTAYDVVLGRGVAGIKGNEFIYQTLVKYDADGYWKKLAAGSTFESINSDAVKGAVISVPQDIDEQKRIGDYFNNLDNLITLHQRKCDTYRKMKKGLMQKLFNQEVCFKKDDGTDYADWEEKSLGELLQYEQPTKYIVASDDYNGCSKYPVLTAGKSFILGYTDETDGVYNKGGVIIFDDFTCDSKYVDFEFKVKSSAMKMLTTVNPNHSLRLIFELMNQIGFEPLGHQRHWISTMSQETIVIPADIEEQTKIANCLAEFDNLIDASERRLEAYKLLKKAMLQKMFV